MNFILFISSVLSVNTVTSVPLSSVISNDTQQVEYIDYCIEAPILILQKTTEVHLYDVLSSLSLNGTYLDIFNDTFDLHQDSLILVDTLISKQFKNRLFKSLLQLSVYNSLKRFIKLKVKTSALN